MLINDIPFQPLPIFLSISQARRSNKEATAYPSIYHPGSRSSQQTNVSSGLFFHRKLATISREYRSPITGHKKQSSLSLSLSPPLPTFLSPSSKDKGSFRNKKTMVTTYHLDRRPRLSRCFIRRNGKLEHGKKAWQNDRRRGFRGLMKRSGRKDENKKKKEKNVCFTVVAHWFAMFDGTTRGVSGLLSLRSAGFAFIYRCSPLLSSPQSTRGSLLSHLLHLQSVHHRSPTQKLIQNGIRICFVSYGPAGQDTCDREA